MKKNTQFKTVWLQLVLIVATLLTAASCKESNKPEDTKKVAEEHNEAKFDNNKEKDAQFLVNAAEINLEEIKLGQLAQQKSTMKDVKALGKMMEDEHNKAWKELTALAGKKLITLPAAATNDAEDAYKKLSEKAGVKFDKEYCDMMVDGHKKALATFEKASTESTDMDIKQWASNMLPALRTHLDHSMTCQKKCENMK